LDRVPGRLANCLRLAGGERLPMRMLDEALFAVPGVLDYRARLLTDGQARRLKLIVQSTANKMAGLERKVKRAASAIPELSRGLTAGASTFETVEVTTRAWTSDGSSKRAFN